MYVADSARMLAAAALIRHPAWELPYAAGVALKKKKKAKKIYLEVPLLFFANMLTTELEMS